jgi:hypothetical protein
LADAISTQKGLLKAQLKGTQNASPLREQVLEVLNGLKQWIGLRTVGRGLMTAKQAAQFGHSPTQPLKQMVESLQAERHRQDLDSRLNGTTSQQPLEQPPQPGGGNTVARQHLRQEQAKGSTAAPALTTIGAKDPLSTQRLSVGHGGIVAIELAVPI